MNVSRLPALPALPPLTLALLLFVIAAFALPTEPAYALVFYLTVIPAWLAALRGIPAPLGLAPLPPGQIIAIALIVWSGLTLLWGHDDKHRTPIFAFDTFCTLIFVLALFASLRAEAARRALGAVLIWCGALNAAFAILLSLILPQHGPRLLGWGITTNPILGAAAIAAAYFAALARAATERRHRAGHLAACALMAAFVMLTESRGPMLALAVASLFLCLAGPKPRLSAGIIAGLALLWLLLPASLHHHQEAVLLQRGISYRPLIWRRSLEMIAQRPLFGHGLAANLDLHNVPTVGDVTFPHDLYLSVLFYSGVAGAALFLALCAFVTLRLFATIGRRDTEWLWTAALWLCGLINGLTDLGQITKGPAEIWLIVWLPAALALAQPTRSRRAPSLASQPCA